MAKIGTFKIESGFNLIDRGLVALGQIIDGVARIGAYANFEADNERVNMEISGVEIVDINREKGEHAVGLIFVYKDETQRKEFETLKLKAQQIDIVYDLGTN